MLCRSQLVKIKTFRNVKICQALKNGRTGEEGDAVDAMVSSYV